MNTFRTHSIIDIDEAAVLHNFHTIQKMAPTSKILAMVKANAYGHGLVRIARALPHAHGFGVACLEEALQLRNAGITQKIVVMRGIFNLTELAIVNQFNLDVVIHCPEQLSLLCAQTHWLKINTGMNRLGFSPKELSDIYATLKKHPQLKINIMTHFSSAEELSSNVTLEQIHQFLNLTKNLKEEKSLANSAGILNFPESRQEWIRPGLILYGVCPIENKTGKDFNLAPVMTWQSQLIAVRRQKKGDAIGYNCTYLCDEDITIGIVGVGYADGYPRHAKNGTPLLVNGIEVPLVGRVSMDMLAVDLRNVPNAKIGDPVTLWGKGLPIEKVACHTATIAYELLCNARLRSSPKEM